MALQSGLHQLRDPAVYKASEISPNAALHFPTTLKAGSVLRSFSTVVFADLSGSTALYESLGNERASQAVTRLTRWMGSVVDRHGGRVVKQLGDGVLSVFANSGTAILAAADLQRNHQINIARWPEAVRMPVRIGVASGEVVDLEGDTYGDAVNVASRLCERAQAHEIWVTDATAVDAGVVPRVRFRRLGVFDIRGKAEAQVVYQAEWRDDEPHDLLTQRAGLPSAISPLSHGTAAIELLWANQVRLFGVAQMPVHVGRAPEAQCFVNDPRVSRMHARVDWRQGSFALTDLSSFGTWVRFGELDAGLRLRRDACMLHGTGSISLGMPFDSGAPALNFVVLQGAV